MNKNWKITLYSFSDDNPFVINAQKYFDSEEESINYGDKLLNEHNTDSDRWELRYKNQFYAVRYKDKGIGYDGFMQQKVIQEKRLKTNKKFNRFELLDINE